MLYLMFVFYCIYFKMFRSMALTYGQPPDLSQIWGWFWGMSFMGPPLVKSQCYQWLTVDSDRLNGLLGNTSAPVAHTIQYTMLCTLNPHELILRGIHANLTTEEKWQEKMCTLNLQYTPPGPAFKANRGISHYYCYKLHMLQLLLLGLTFLHFKSC